MCVVVDAATAAAAVVVEPIELCWDTTLTEAPNEKDLAIFPSDETADENPAIPPVDVDLLTGTEPMGGNWAKVVNNRGGTNVVFVVVEACRV